jgi:hypothetical protein
MELGVRPERAGEDDRRGPLIDTKLDDSSCALGETRERSTFGVRVHRPRRDQAGAERDRAQARVVAELVGRQAP